MITRKNGVLAANFINLQMDQEPVRSAEKLDPRSDGRDLEAGVLEKCFSDILVFESDFAF